MPLCTLRTRNKTLLDVSLKMHESLSCCTVVQELPVFRFATRQRKVHLCAVQQCVSGAVKLVRYLKKDTYRVDCGWFILLKPSPEIVILQTMHTQARRIPAYLSVCDIGLICVPVGPH